MEVLNDDFIMLDVGETAKIMGCSVSHINRELKAGRFPEPKRVGRLRRWLKSELLAWVEGGCK